MLIKTLIDLQSILCLAPKLVAADTETYKLSPTESDARLLGLSLSWIRPGDNTSQKVYSHYIPFWEYRDRTWHKHFDPTNPVLQQFLEQHNLIGWNAAFDRTWLNHCTRSSSNWIADGRIMWHLANEDETIRGFGLKLAQQRLLGWTETNEQALALHVAAKGGTLRNGDHYLADLDVLAHYANLDTESTLLCFYRLAPFFDTHNYWNMANRILTYSFHLKAATDFGVRCDKGLLGAAAQHYSAECKMAEQRLREECGQEIGQIEAGWKTQKCQTYKTERGKQAFLETTARHSRFNLASSHQRALLLHNILELPIAELTPTGKPKTDRSSIALLQHPAAACLVDYSENRKMQEVANSFIEHWRNGRVHPGYNVCATVSGRLGGFSPYLLNAPFSEPRIMEAFKVEEGYIGVHADLTAIEPCLVAAYSEDPNLLKVYRDGEGDIYLDLALELFPDRQDLASEYDPHGPAPTSALKDKYKDIRAICKIIHLAVGYTGSFFTVSKNLTKAGFPTSEGEARMLVRRYWKKFAKVKEFNKKLQQAYEKAGYINNVLGRIIKVDPNYRKDTLNRLIQSSGHDILIEWVFAIIWRCGAQQIDWKPWLLDVHDSCTIQVPIDQAENTKAIFLDTLKDLNTRLNLGVTIRAEVKTCTTLAGLKG